MRPIKRKSPPTLRKRALWIAGFLLIVVGLFGTLQAAHVIHFFQKKPIIAAHTNDESTKGELTPNGAPTPGTGTQTPAPSNSTSTGNAGTGSSESTDKSATPPPSANAQPPAAPSGNFVSNYKPNLSGSPTPNLIQSVCVTSPGATCVISFTKDSVTKSLKATKTDAGGSAYWTWKLQDIGLTTGSWQIKAIATLNGQTATTNDQLTLDVQP